MPNEERITEDEHGQPVIQIPLVNELRSIQQTISDGFGEMRGRLDGKADKADLDRIDRRMDEHGQRLDKHIDDSSKRFSEIDDWHSKGTWTWALWQKVAGAVFAVAMLVATLLSSSVAHWIGH